MCGPLQPKHLPAIYCQIIQDDVCRSASRICPVQLHVHQQNWRPSQVVCAKYRCVDLRGRAIQHHRFVGDPSRIISRVAELYVMPCICRPVPNVAGCRGVGPCNVRSIGGPLVHGDVPGIAPSIALHAVNHGLSTRQYLVQIQFAGSLDRYSGSGYRPTCRKENLKPPRHHQTWCRIVHHRNKCRRSKTSAPRRSLMVNL